MYLRLKYLKFLNLQNYEENNNVIIFRCPICGDSKKSKTKKRGYILSIESEKCRYYCHDCGINIHFVTFLREVNYSIYLDYLEEKRKEDVENFTRFNDEISTVEIVSSKIKQPYNNIFSKYLYTIEETKDDNESKVYLRNRKIPEKHFRKIYYFNGNVYKLYKDMFNSDKWDHKIKINKNYKGIIVPFINRFNENVGFGFRMINNPFMRFINLYREDHNSQFFFGENECNFDDHIFIVEGMFDKLSFTNDKQVLCMTSSNSRLKYINQITNNKVTYIFDFEYLNESINKKIEEVIKEGHNIFLWNSDIFKGKDINDLRNFYDKDDKKLFDFIKNNSYSYDIASLEFNRRRGEMTESLLWR